MDSTPEPEAPKAGGNRLILIGGGVALLAGVVVAGALVMGGRGERTPPPPASQAGLIIESGPDDGRIDPTRPLRCFVQGQFAGELSLADCARRNGVATDALDVGIDSTGALAASQAAGVMLTPLPPEQGVPAPVEAAPADTESLGAEAVAGPQSVCWRHSRGQWTRIGDAELNGCVQTLFAGRCERAGNASYGRWGDQTLRLVAGRVEISADNKSFRTLVNQGPNCSIPIAG